EFATDADLRDFRFGHRQQIRRLTKPRRTRVRARLAGDHVHHRRLAGAVRSDDAAKLARVHVQRQRVQRLEAVEAHGDVFEIQDRAVRGIARGRLFAARAGPEDFLPAVAYRGCGVHAVTASPTGCDLARANRSPSPTTPRGRNKVTSTNSAPSA